MGILDGKTALITGGARGIGKAVGKYFAKEGAYVAITDLAYDEAAQETEKEILEEGTKAIAYAADVKDTAAAQQLVDKVHDDFGRIDILVNNAGITKDNLLMRMSEKDWDDVIQTNLKSVFNYTKAIQQVMMRQKCGSIINISSVVGMMGNAGQANYSSSKAGIIGFTKSIAKELGSRSIRSNAIAPGFIESEMTEKLPEDKQKEYKNSIPLRRFGNTEEIAKVAAFLASDLSSYVNGQVLSVCGGMNI